MARRISNTEGERRSSLFDIQKPPPKDSGSSVISLTDIPSIAKRGPRIQYENTFKMEPDRKCEVNKIKPIIKEVLEETFKDFAYDPIECGNLCKLASTTIKDAVKQLQIERYKVVVVVTCSQNVGQGVKKASRFLWDAGRDTWIDGEYSNHSLQAQAVLYALYYE